MQLYILFGVVLNSSHIIVFWTIEEFVPVDLRFSFSLFILVGVVFLRFRLLVPIRSQLLLVQFQGRVLLEFLQDSRLDHETVQL